MITIYLHDNGRVNLCDQPVAAVNVYKDDSISILAKYISDFDSKMILFSNYTVLIDIFTFGFYGITQADENDHCHLFFVPKPPPKSETKIKKQRNAKSISKLGKCKSNSCFCPYSSIYGENDDLKKEFFDNGYEKARIRDIFFSRIEGSVSCHRKVVIRFKELMTTAKSIAFKEDESETIVPSYQTASPSTDVLPNIWDKQDDHTF